MVFVGRCLFGHDFCHRWCTDAFSGTIPATSVGVLAEKCPEKACLGPKVAENPLEKANLGLENAFSTPFSATGLLRVAEIALEKASADDTPAEKGGRRDVEGGRRCVGAHE